MGILLRFEIRKLFRQKSFYICLAVMLAFTLISILIFDLANDFMAGFEEGFSSETGESLAISINPIDNPGAVGTVVTALTGTDLVTILAILISLIVCRDYSSKTIKNIIGKGYSRTKIVAAKAMTVCIAIGLYVVVEWLFAYIVGYAFLGFTYGWTWKVVGTLAIQFVGALAIGMMFLTISLLLRKTGSSIALNILIAPIVSIITSLIDVIIKNKSFSINNYWLNTCFTQICQMEVPMESMVRCIVCFTVYLLVFSLLPFIIGKKQEV